MDSEPTVITLSLLRHLTLCQRRAWLDQHGDPAESSSLSVEAPSTDVEALYTVQAGQLQRIALESWAHGVAMSRDLIEQRADTILNACLEVTAPMDLSARLYTLRGTVDQLQRVQDQTGETYSVAVHKPQGSPEDADWLQLDLCVWLLQAHLGSAPPAELWLGASADRPPRHRIPHDYDESRLLRALTQAAELLDAQLAPPPNLLPHCTTCDWYAACQGVARQAGSLDLLYAVSRATRQHMRQAGLTTLTAVAASSPEELQRVKGIGPATAPTIRANARAWLERRPIWYGPPPPLSDEPPWMFDLETLDANGRIVPWCMGWCDPDGATQIALVAPVREPEQCGLANHSAVTLVPDSDAAWRVFAAAMSTSAAPIYHWTGYDVGILRNTAPTDVKARLEPRMRDMHRLFTRTISLPLKSTSIKAVSVYLGFPWFGTTDWFEAYQDYVRWLATEDPAALERTCTYQGEDVQSMAWVWRWLVANLPEA